MGGMGSNSGCWDNTQNPGWEMQTYQQTDATYLDSTKHNNNSCSYKGDGIDCCCVDLRAGLSVIIIAHLSGTTVVPGTSTYYSTDQLIGNTY